MSELTVFSYGGGQDSFTILLMLVYDRNFRRKYAPNRLLVLMSDTGEEHPETYQHVNNVVYPMCKAYEIEFRFITNDMGFHSDAWKTLTHQYRRNNMIGNAAFRQTCTDNLKIKVIDNYVENWLKINYFWGMKLTRKRAYYDFKNQFGKIKLLLGFAAGEEKRVKGNALVPKWKQECVEKVYPLIDLEMDRAACHTKIAEYGYEIPMPSNCMICFYMSQQELLWLYRNYPNKFGEWVELEKNKMEKSRRLGVPDNKNYGAFASTKTLEQKLSEAQVKYGHWSNEELHNYKMSHGHCVRSKY